MKTLKIGQTVFLRVQSGAIISGQIMHIYVERSVTMVRISHEDLVYNVSAAHIVDKLKRTSR